MPLSARLALQSPACALETSRGLIRRIFVLPIRIYRLCISPLFPPACRFYPSCSAYALEAILRHGIPRGCFLALKRLIRCHPWSPGGYDPVPPSSRLPDFTE